eukprot:scaffold35304_cov152-Isochrysis_galbana.AAC.2
MDFCYLGLRSMEHGWHAQSVRSTQEHLIARSNTPTKKHDLITICSDGRSEGQLRFVLIQIESLRSKIQVFSTSAVR